MAPMVTICIEASQCKYIFTIETSFFSIETNDYWHILMTHFNKTFDFVSKMKYTHAFMEKNPEHLADIASLGSSWRTLTDPLQHRSHLVTLLTWYMKNVPTFTNITPLSMRIFQEVSSVESNYIHYSDKQEGSIDSVRLVRVRLQKMEMVTRKRRLPQCPKRTLDRPQIIS
jgi:hypothetical protein